MKVKFLGHSGFFLELLAADLLFDYYTGDLPDPDPGKPLYVFVSHVHGDHFSRSVFPLAEKTERIRYIISDDVPESKVPEQLRREGRVRFTGPDEDFTVPFPAAPGMPETRGGEGIRVRTFRSTDAGVAFLVDVPGAFGTEETDVVTSPRRERFLRIYHAGDLNDWHWDDVDKAWNDEQFEGYQDALGKIAACVRPDGRLPDAAFVPVDTRLGDGAFFWMGLDEFMQAVGAEHIFPMHLFGDPAVIDRMRNLPCAAGYRDKILGSGTPGEIFEI